MAQLNDLIVNGASRFIGTAYGNFNGSISYTTTAPTAANTTGLKIAVLSSDPSTKYSGWLYLITG